MEISKGRARVNKTAVILFFSFKIWSFQIVQTVWEADTHLISTTGLLWGLICYLICLHFRSLTVAYCFQQFVVCSVCCSRRLCAHTASSVHGGGSVMAWVCVAARGTDYVTAVRGDRMKCEVYRAALSAHIQTNAAKLLRRSLAVQMEPTVVVKKDKVTSEIVSLSKNWWAKH